MSVAEGDSDRANESRVDAPQSDSAGSDSDQLLSSHDTAVQVETTRLEKIPPELRTRPMTLQEGARLMGYTGSRIARQLRSAMDAEAIAYEKLTRQSFIFDRRSFPKESWPEVIPTKPM
jgi:hypothetical protein